jgi:cytochrome P450
MLEFIVISKAVLIQHQAMVLHPEVRKKAHAELDRVVGPDRLPSWDDYSELHYIRCIIKELLRCEYPLQPLSIATRLNQDTERFTNFLDQGCL